MMTEIKCGHPTTHVNQKDENGETCIMKTMNTDNDLNYLLLLISKGACPLIRNNEKKLPIENYDPIHLPNIYCIMLHFTLSCAFKEEDEKAIDTGLDILKNYPYIQEISFIELVESILKKNPEIFIDHNILEYFGIKI